MTRRLTFPFGLVALAATLTASACSSSSNPGGPDGAAMTPDAQPEVDAGADAMPDGGAAPECHWPASLNDAGPGACAVGRAFVSCSYPSGVSCEGGGGASSPSGVSMGCISDDPTRCQGCGSTSGAATCKNMCAPDEYAVSCGGPPHPSIDGGPDTFVYQQAPTNCRGVGVTPGGNQYSCCPCE